MLQAKSIETSKGHNTRGMKYQSQLAKAAMERPKPCQNSDQNNLKWWHEKQERHAHVLAHKQGTKLTSQKQLKSEHDKATCTEIMCEMML